VIAIRSRLLCHSAGDFPGEALDLAALHQKKNAQWGRRIPVDVIHYYWPCRKVYQVTLSATTQATIRTWRNGPQPTPRGLGDMVATAS
jgi:hypothetical protein